MTLFSPVYKPSKYVAAALGAALSMAFGCADTSSPAPVCVDGASRIVFVDSVDYRQFDIFSIEAAGGPRKRLTHDKASFHPDASPDGQTIVFASGRRGRWEETSGWSSTSIYFMNPDGSSQRQAFPGSDDDDPSWSPDGRRIAFVRMTRPYGDWRGAWAIYVFDLSTDSVKRITELNDRPLQHPVWSRNGKSLVYQRDRALWLVSSTGGDQRELGGTAHHAATWSPVGDAVAYPVVAGDAVDVVTRDLRSSTERRIIPNATLPAWFAPDRIAVLEAVHGDPGIGTVNNDDLYLGVAQPSTGRVHRVPGGPHAHGFVYNQFRLSVLAC